MAEIKIPREYELDWDDIAIDDGSIIIESPSYAYLLESYDGTERTTGQIERIRYSPEVNTAPSMQLSVPENEDITGDVFLGGDLTVYINDGFLFNGRVVRVETQKRTGESYNIKARSKGQQIDGDSIDERPQNVILQDFLAKIIDKYNEYDSEALDIVEANDEILYDVIELGQVTRVPDGNSGAVRYNNVGPDASNIDVIYVKIKVDEYANLLIVNGSSTVEFDRIEDIENGQYGTWVAFFPENNDSISYDLEIQMEGSESVLYDWIAITDAKVKREVIPFQAEAVDSNLVIQNADSNAEFNQVFGL